jgi:hypothetical protein
MHPDGWDVRRCPVTYLLAGGESGPMDGTSCINEEQGFSLDTLPLNESEGTRHNVMMISMSSVGTQANPAKSWTNHILKPRIYGTQRGRR